LEGVEWKDGTPPAATNDMRVYLMILLAVAMLLIAVIAIAAIAALIRRRTTGKLSLV